MLPIADAIVVTICISISIIIWWCRPAKYSFSLYKINSAALALVKQILGPTVSYCNMPHALATYFFALSSYVIVNRIMALMKDWLRDANILDDTSVITEGVLLSRLDLED